MRALQDTVTGRPRRLHLPRALCRGSLLRRYNSSLPLVNELSRKLLGWDERQA